MLVPARIQATLSWAVEGYGRALVFFLGALLAQIAFPRLRRNDLAVLAVMSAIILELIQAFVGREPGMAGIGLGVLGVAAAWAPGAVEHLRELYRTKPFVALTRRAPKAEPAASSTAAGAERRKGWKSQGAAEQGACSTQ